MDPNYDVIFKKNIMNTLKEGDEIEVKFYKFDKDSLKELTKFLDNSDNGYIKTHEETIDYLYPDSKRITVYDDRMENTTKTNKWYYGSKFKGDHFKITISTEEKETINVFNTNYNKERKKDRTSYSKDNYRIDITYVNSNVEIELEVIDALDFNYDEFFVKLNEIYYILLPYPSKLKEVIKFFNTELTQGKDTSSNINLNYFSKARDLELRDLTYDSMIENKYSFSIKASGVPQFLIYHHTGIWFYYPSLNELESITYITYPTYNFTNAILVGELLTCDDMKEGKGFLHKYRFLPYDALYHNVNLINKNYVYRKSVADSFTDDIISKDGGLFIDIKEKKNYIYKDVPEFYNSMNKVMKEIDVVDYKTDGIIFTPIEDRYIAEGQIAGNSKERILSKYKDVCKWKPTEEQTIDYKVSKINEDEYKLSWSSKYKFTKYQNIHAHNFIKSNYNDSFLKDEARVKLDLDKETKQKLDKEDLIIEFKIHKIKEKCFNLKSNRIRYDKDFPNSLYVVDKNWSLIMQPILNTTLCGKDTVLMKRYHNTIKLKLLEDIDGYVLDIGSGKGGDINKYKNAKKVLLVEPNKDFLLELNRRLKKINVKDKFKVLNARGEDGNKILQELKIILPKDLENNTLYITFMISLTFFWKDIKTLKSLADTITKINEYIVSINGKVVIVFLTISGKYMKEIFDGKSMVQLNTITLKKISENSLSVEIKDSATVRDIQEEYLVNIDDLMKLVGFKTIFIKKPDYSKVLMSLPEMKYTSVLELGFSIYDKEIINIEPSTSLKVNEKKATKKSGIQQALGDDEYEKIDYIGKDFYRISCLSTNNFSLLHAVLKSTNIEYQQSNVFDRVKLVQKYFKTLNKNLDLNNISKNIKKNIGVYYGDILTKYEHNFNECIYLNKCKNDLYEPIIKIVEDKKIYTFNTFLKKQNTLNFNKFKEVTLPPEEGENNLYILYAISNLLFKIINRLEKNDMSLELKELEDVHYSKSLTKTELYESPNIKYSYNNKSNLGEKIDNQIYDKLVYIDNLALEEEYKNAFKECIDLIYFIKHKFYNLSEGNIRMLIKKCMDIITIYERKLISEPNLEL